jgi:Domain of unknown function (DUF4149)
MHLALRYVYLLALVVWLGGMVVLGALVAPTVFQVLQAADPMNGRVLAGQFFGEAISRFHPIAYGAGGVMLVVLVVTRVAGPRPLGFAVRVAIVAGMLGVSLYSGRVVLRRVDAIQQQVGTLPSRLPAGDPRRVEFDGLHALSTRLMQLNMVGALALLVWEARERIG